MNKYMMLDRLRSDCEYYLGFGNKCEKDLWAGSPVKQILEMYRLYYSIPYDARPEWLKETQIAYYNMRMNSVDARKAMKHQKAFKYKFGSNR